MSLIKKVDKDNRQRVGGLSSKRVSVYSYHNVRNETEEGTGRDPARSIIGENRLSKFLNRVGATVFLLVCIICLVSILSLSSVPKVVLVGSKTSDELYNRYKQSFISTSQKLLGSSLFNRDKLTINTNGITAQLMKDYPEFSQITMSMPLIGQHPVIYVSESSLALTLSNPAGEYIINSYGIAVLNGLVSKSLASNLPNVQDQTGLYISLGKAALTSDDVSFITTINYQLAAKGYKVSSYVLPAGTSELDVHITNEPYYVKFNLQDNNPKVQVGRYLAVANYFKQNNISPSSYVDVRTDGRVFYK